MKFITALLAASLLVAPAEARGIHGGIPGPSTGASALTLTDVNVKIFQRVGTTKDVPISGTYSGTPTGIQCQIPIVAGGTALTWTNATNYSAVAGNWTAKCPGVPQGAWYTMQVRDNVNTSVTANGLFQFGVGVVIWAMGQSNVQNLWGVGEGAPGATVDQYTKDWNGTAWVTPRDGTIGSGQGYMYLTNFVRSALGGTIPVALIPSAIGGTSITCWQTVQTCWTSAAASNSTGISLCQNGAPCDAEIAIWQQGETDAQNGSTNPTTYYYQYLKNVHQQALTVTGRSAGQLKFGVASLGSFETGSAYNDTFINNIRQYDIGYPAGTVLDGVTPLTGSFYLSSMQDLLLWPGQNPHWNNGNCCSIIQYWIAGRRYAASINKALGLTATGAEGPKITGQSWTAGSPTLTLNITHSGGTNLAFGPNTFGTSGSGMTYGFRVTDTTASSSVSVSSVSLGTNTITLTMGANAISGHNYSLAYGMDKNPFTQGAAGSDNQTHMIYDNQTCTTASGPACFIVSPVENYNDAGFPLQFTPAPITFGVP